MIVDARSLPQNQVVETDICIVGSGTAGMTLAREFIGQEFRVCLLESGGLKPDQETQALYRGENIGHPYFTLDSARARYFGGSTNRWHIAIGDNCVGARMRPLDEIDFEERDWVPYCRVHGISNLFIAGPSVFPTGGYANPSLTIVALAVRLADHIKRELRTTRHFLVRQGRRKYER